MLHCRTFAELLFYFPYLFCLWFFIDLALGFSIVSLCLCSLSLEYVSTGYLTFGIFTVFYHFPSLSFLLHEHSKWIITSDWFWEMLLTPSLLYFIMVRLLGSTQPAFLTRQNYVTRVEKEFVGCDCCIPPWFHLREFSDGCTQDWIYSCLCTPYFTRPLLRRIRIYGVF